MFIIIVYFRYFLTAIVLIQPVYKQDLIGSWELSGWKQSIMSTSAHISPNPMDSSCVLAYEIQLDASAKQLLKQRDYIIIDFAFDLAALWTYMLVGYSALWVWQNYGPYRDAYAKTQVQRDTIDDSGKITKNKFAGLQLSNQQIMETQMEEACEELVSHGSLSRADFQAVMSYYADEQEQYKDFHTGGEFDENDAEINFAKDHDAMGWYAATLLPSSAG